MGYFVMLLNLYVCGVVGWGWARGEGCRGREPL